MNITLRMKDGVSAGPVAGRLDGKVVLITGVGGGQGRAAALLFAKAGAVVVGNDCHASGIAETAALAEKAGHSVDLTVCDAADPDECGAWVDAAVKQHGRIDVLYNNAAYAHFGSVADLAPQQWRDTLRGQLDIVFFPVQSVWPHLIRNGGGAIINIASVSGMRATEGIGASALAAGKAGVIGLTHQLALEGAPHWIRVNTISPGPIMTIAAEAAFNKSPELREAFEGLTLLARTGQPMDVAYAALFLASDEAAFITGANLTVDGGWSSKGGFTRH